MSKISRNDKLTSFQVFSVLAVGLISINGYTLARAVGEAAGADGWISVLLVGVMTAVGAVIVISLGLRFPGRTNYAFNKLLLGRYLGTALNTAHIIYDILVVAVVVRTYLDLSIFVALRQTPPVLIIAISLALIVNAVWQGPLTVARLSELTLLLITVLGFTLTGLLSHTDLATFLPVGSGGAAKIAAGLIPALPSFLGFHLLFVFLPLLQQPKTVKKTALLSVAYVTAYNTAIFLAIVGFFGIERTLMLTWPSIEYVKTIALPFLERVDIPIIIAWVVVMLVSAAIYFYVALTGLTATLGPRTRPYAAAGLALACYFVITRPDNLVDIKALTDIAVVFGIAVDLVLPAVLLILAAVRGKGETS